MTEVFAAMELSVDDTVELGYSRPGGTSTVAAVFQGADDDYSPGEYQPEPPRLLFEDPTRDDRDFAVYPNSLGRFGSLHGIYTGEQSPNERNLGEIEKVSR